MEVRMVKKARCLHAVRGFREREKSPALVGGGGGGEGEERERIWSFFFFHIYNVGKRQINKEQSEKLEKISLKTEKKMVLGNCTKNNRRV